MSIIKKLTKIAAEIEPLTKADKNEEGGWSFVSIDDYYATAGKAMAREGLLWSLNETGFHHLAGSVYAWRFSVAIRSSDEDGENEIIPDYVSFTCLHQIDGPQTTGKVVSYAEKIAIRAILKLVTGEPDADSSRKFNQLIEAAPATKPKPEAAPGKALPLSYEGIIMAINDAEKIDELELFVKRNKTRIDFAKANDPDQYKAMTGAYRDRMAELRKAAKVANEEENLDV